MRIRRRQGVEAGSFRLGEHEVVEVVSFVRRGKLTIREGGVQIICGGLSKLSGGISSQRLA